jgi:PAS domain-containing protein
LTNKQKTIEFEAPRPDDFQCGALITDKNRKIVYANAYFSEELNWKLETLIGKNSDDLFTYSSKIFCESYLMPLLLHEKKCEEMQLTLLDGIGAFLTRQNATNYTTSY